MFHSSLQSLISVDAPQPEGQAKALHVLLGSSFPSHCESATMTDFLEIGLLPAINTDKLQVLLGVAQILLPISFLHDRFECVFIISTYC